MGGSAGVITPAWAKYKKIHSNKSLYLDIGSWDKTCCDGSETGHPIIRPPSNVSDADLAKVFIFYLLNFTAIFPNISSGQQNNF